MPAQDTHIGRSTPLGPMVMGATFRGFATLTRGYRIVRPLRGRQLRGMCCTDIGTRTAVPQRHAAEMMAGTAAPRGPNYSITAGEHGEPADGEPHIYVRPQGGRTGIRSAQPATAADRWRAATRKDAGAGHAHRAFDPLGADGGGGHSPRVRHAHPRRDGPRKQTTAPARKRGAVVGDIYRRMPGDGFISPLSCHLRCRCRRGGLRGPAWHRRRDARTVRLSCRHRRVRLRS